MTLNTPPSTRFDNKDLIVFSHLRWEFVKQRPQHLMERMASDRKVLFVEEPMKPNGYAQGYSRIKNVGENIWVLQIWSETLDSDLFTAKINEALDLLNIVKPIAWFYSAAFVEFAQKINHSAVVYDCMDELSAFNGASQTLRLQEKELLSIADVVFTGGRSLYESKSKQHTNVHCFPSSVEEDHFAQAIDGSLPTPKDIENIPWPIVGFYGVIDERMDLELLDKTAKLLPTVSFVFIGPIVKIDPATLPVRKNIHYLGMKSYDELPNYLQHFSVAYMPFALNQATEFISPTKTLEFMAAHKPIVSTAIYDVKRDYGHMVPIISTAAEAKKAITHYLNESDDDKAQRIAKQIEVLAKTSWDKTAAEMKALMEEAGYTNHTKHMKSQGKIVIIGAGISGATLAERYANAGKRVVVLEKRDHIGGNCYDYYNEDGILVSKYGAHLFHTNYDHVWKYVNRFAEWYPYEHKVLAKVDGQLVPVPVNITTVNKLFGLNIQNEDEMKQWLDEHQVKNDDPKNGKDAALARVGEVLYEKIFKNYTKKQWDKYPEQLDASVLNRIPVRTDFDDRYFSDEHQALPKGGYTKLFEKMLDHPNITVLLNTDYFDVREELEKEGYEKLFYTGPIDQFFDFKYSVKRKLEYRSIWFVHETHDVEYYQENSVINYPNDEGFTRIVEYKHITGQKHPKTTIVKEFTTDEGEPYYPVPNPDNQAIYDEYKREADKLDNIYFVGRLANYKYFNMDEAFKNALELFDQLWTEEQATQRHPSKTKRQQAGVSAHAYLDR